MSFSALDREQHLAELSQGKWDLLIIGGGITGAGILLDAVSRGLKAALIEKGDFASGTSSRSTKLIHGGLRYLKRLDIGLVREVGKERAVAHTNARHLVRPEAMLLPMYHDGSLGRITGAVGLWIYDWLADVEESEHRKMLSREETLEQEPELRQEGLLGAGLYYEYRTDDARLTISVLKTAVAMGGLALNYCGATGFVYHQNSVAGVQCTDSFTGKIIDVSASVVVNATGPWMDSVLEMQQHAGALDKNLLLSKGVHIVVPKSVLPIRQSMYFDTPEDGRMIFAIPRDQCVYIGTTDTVYDGALEKVEVTEEEKTYLLHAVNHVLENKELQANHITGAWAGVRPLIYEEGKAPSELSRKDEIFVSPQGLISIAGGKLTGYRKMAERIVDLVAKRLESEDIETQPCRTQDLRLVGSKFESEEEMLLILKGLFEAYSGFSARQIEKLFSRYGDETEHILSQAKTGNSSSALDPLVCAEVAFSIDQEMTHHLSDFVYLRTSDVFFDPEHLRGQIEDIAGAFASHLNWDDRQIRAEKRAVGFK